MKSGWCTDWMDFLEPKCPELEEDSHSKFQHHVNIRSIIFTINIMCSKTWYFLFWTFSAIFHSLLCCPTCWSFLFTCAERYAWSCWSFALQPPPGIGGAQETERKWMDMVHWQVAETWTRNPFLTCGFSVNSQRLCWISRYAQNPLGAAEYQKVPEMMRWFWHHLLPTLELHSLATNMRCAWLQHSFGSTTRPQSH